MLPPGHLSTRILPLGEASRVSCIKLMSLDTTKVSSWAAVLAPPAPKTVPGTVQGTVQAQQAWREQPLLFHRQDGLLFWQASLNPRLAARFSYPSPLLSLHLACSHRAIK